MGYVVFFLKGVKMQGLCLEGGGILGMVYAGACDHFKSYTHFAGSSAGAIICGLLAAGASSDFVKGFLDIDFIKLFDYSLGSASRLKNKAGLCKGDKLEELYGKALERLLGSSNITFRELYNRTGKFLVVTVTEVFNKAKTIYINPNDHPDVLVKRAVRCSSSYPYVFSTKPYDYVFGVSKPSVLSDGGILDNYPINILEKYIPKETIIGIKVDGKKENLSKVDVVGFSKAIISTLRHKELSQDEEQRTLVIKCDVKTLDFGITKEQKIKLFELGKAEVTNFLRERSL